MPRVWTLPLPAAPMIALVTLGGCGDGSGRAGTLVEDAGTGPIGALDATALVDLETPPPDLAPPADLTTPPDLLYVPQPTAACAVPTMDQLYPGALPPNPYMAGPVADPCVAAPHDAIIVLGCPSNADGTPSACQTKRADIAVALSASGYGDRFIVTGAAVHNAFVEADALAALLEARGVDPARIEREPMANHTDENIYYGTRIMEARGWASAVVVSEDPGHLVMTAVCDANCCVELGRLTVVDFPVSMGNQTTYQKAGHYVRLPWASAPSAAECQHIQGPLKFMCVNLSKRLACADDFKL